MERATLQRPLYTLPPPKLDRRAGETLHAQVYGWLRRAIWRGGISRNTALYAYNRSLYAHS